MTKYILSENGTPTFTTNSGATWLYDSTLKDVNDLRLPITVNPDLSVGITALNGDKITLQLTKSS